MVLGTVFIGSRLLRELESVRRVQALVLEQEELSTRFHRDGASLVAEWHAAVLRLGAADQPPPSAREEVDVLHSRAQTFFASPPVHLVTGLGEGLADVRSQISLYQERSTEWLAQPREERLARLSLLQDTQATLLREIHALADAGTQQVNRMVLNLQESLAAVRLLLFASVIGLIAALAGLFWLVTRAWLRPLLAQVAAADAQTAAQRELASLGVLAAGLAHEIRNPMGALKNRAYALGLLVDATQNPKAAQQIHSMNGEIDRVERIVRDFLDYASPQAPRLETLTAREWIESFIADHRSEVESRGITLKMDLPDHWQDVSLRVDAGQLRQVLLNLLRNAIEAASPASQDSVISISGEASGTWIELRLSDNGPGVPPEMREQIFTPFATTKHGGTGLGLPISRSIARRHGGDVFLETPSPTGVGASFLLRLPLGPPPSALPGES
ncbi:hypothetical protein BGE01nite_42270 [Brevifollis gellanilyticus]|uniref:histidine kinase n=2 Tax=Brevifollis gellanilyticus TaxID=748831 RepID=A0A512MDY0_9BACT|nr:hypothetical protein BGE01nite_42270 [Brevifollis gellanilyticus]